MCSCCDFIIIIIIKFFFYLFIFFTETDIFLFMVFDRYPMNANSASRLMCSNRNLLVHETISRTTQLPVAYHDLNFFPEGISD